MKLEKRYRAYKKTLDILDKKNIPYVIGGGIAVIAYCNRKSTKDLDIYVKYGYEDNAISSLRGEGYDINEMPDVDWLSKAYYHGLIIDFIIKNMGDILTTDETIAHGRHLRRFGQNLFYMGPEDLILRKIMAMNSKRDDWYDAISVLSSTHEYFDWDFFIKISKGYLDRAMSFILFVRSDKEHIIPIPDFVVKELAKGLK
jgi:hypothetical protein